MEKETKQSDKKEENKKEAVKVEDKKEEAVKVEDKRIEETKKKEAPKEVFKKEVAIVNGSSLRISPKHSKFICKMIMGKSIDKSIELLEEVIIKKRAVKMDGAEIPHRKGKGMMSGRYPVNASKEFIVLLKQLKANANVNQIDEPVIVLAMANKATLPYKRDGKRGKRAHVRIEVMDKTKLKIAKK
jgi:ribosomal protein L22